MDERTKEEFILQGIGASPGIAHGRAFVVAASELEVPVYQIDESQIEGEIERFEQALVATRKQIQAVQAEIEKNLGEDEARIFDAHLLVLEDQALIGETIRELNTTRRNIEVCFRDVANRYIAAFDQIDDEYLRERAADIRDVVERVLHNLTGRAIAKLSEVARDRILFTHNLSTSDSAGLDQSGILGLVTDTGGRTSHAVIMARSMKIPAVVGVENATSRVQHGDWVIVDGYDGLVIVNPSEKTLFRYGKLQLHRKSIEKKILAAAHEPAVTLDGQRVSLVANIENILELESAASSGAEGVGLFRTENLFMQTEVFPSEDMQCEVYRKAAEFFGDRPVIIRTMDIGGDKPVKWASFRSTPEANPFLGSRGIRFCLENAVLFKDQLRAILRASAHGNIKVMFPMISGTDELDRAVAMLEEAKEELRRKGIPFNQKIEVGSMIEIPGAALTCDLLAGSCDFFSIGTNDLIQYMLAVDRVNPRTAHLYQPAHPAVLRMLRIIFDSARKTKTPVSVCGEMAGDPLMAPILLGLGADQLSVAPSSLPTVKYLVQHMKLADARKLARDVLRVDDPRKTIELSRAFFTRHLGAFASELI